MRTVLKFDVIQGQLQHILKKTQYGKYRKQMRKRGERW